MAVPSIPPSIARVLDAALDRAPDHEALVTRSRRLTYAELDAEANQAARALQSLGIGPGDRVAASLPNEAAVVVAFHGAMRLVAVWHGIASALAPPDQRFQPVVGGAPLFLYATSEAGRQGRERGSTCRASMQPHHKKKKNKET